MPPVEESIPDAFWITVYVNDEGHDCKGQITILTSYIGISSTHHQLIRDLGDDHAKCKDVKARMVLENLTGGLFKDDEGQREDEADV